MTIFRNKLKNYIQYKFTEITESKRRRFRNEKSSSLKPEVL